MSRIDQIIKTLEAEEAELLEQLGWVQSQLETFRQHAKSATPTRRSGGGPVTGRSTGGARGRRNSAPAEKSSRARARSDASKPRRRDMADEITRYLAKNPGSTASAVATALDAKRNSVATKLTQMTKAGRLVKAERGYTVPKRAASAE